MRRTRFNGNFFICLLFNMLLNFEYTIPAWILLALHFFIDLPIWWFFLALAIWIAGILLWMRIIGWAGDCSMPDSKKANKNPYSAREYTKYNEKSPSNHSDDSSDT